MIFHTVDDFSYSRWFFIGYDIFSIFVLRRLKKNGRLYLRKYYQWFWRIDNIKVTVCDGRGDEGGVYFALGRSNVCHVLGLTRALHLAFDLRHRLVDWPKGLVRWVVLKQVQSIYGDQMGGEKYPFADLMLRTGFKYSCLSNHCFLSMCINKKVIWRAVGILD